MIREMHLSSALFLITSTMSQAFPILSVNNTFNHSNELSFEDIIQMGFHNLMPAGRGVRLRWLRGVATDEGAQTQVHGFNYLSIVFRPSRAAPEYDIHTLPEDLIDWTLPQRRTVAERREFRDWTYTEKTLTLDLAIILMARNGYSGPWSYLLVGALTREPFPGAGPGVFFIFGKLAVSTTWYYLSQDTYHTYVTHSAPLDSEFQSMPNSNFSTLETLSR